MAVQTAATRTSASDLQLSMEHPSEDFIRRYALEVFGDRKRTGDWLRSQIPALGNATPESLLESSVDESLRRVLSVLVQIDYGVVGQTADSVFNDTPTMRVFRLYKDGRLPNDAMGAKISGGRWNPRGFMVLYAATHLSLACLEKMVHLERGTMPLKLRYGWTEIPSNLESLDPTEEFIRRGHSDTAEIGKQWLVHRSELAVRVPSALIPGEDNVLLNPLHPDYDALQWDSLPFDWETRLLELITAVPRI